MAKRKAKKRRGNQATQNQKPNNILSLPNGVDIVIKEEKVRTSIHPKPVSNHQILNYLIGGGLYHEFKSFLDHHYSINALTTPVEQLALTEAIWIMRPNASQLAEAQYQEVIDELKPTILDPLSAYFQETAQGKILISSMRSVYREYIKTLIDHAVCVMGENGELCHTLDIEGVGGYTQKALEQTYVDIGLDVNDPEIKQLACNGFRQTCNHINRNKPGERYHILNWYLNWFKLTESRRCICLILKHMQELCQKGRPQRDFLLDYYESNRETFNQMFQMFPQYDFIEHGKCERYRLLGDFAEKLGITMEEVYNFAGFFSKTASEKQVERTGHSQTGGKPTDDRTYRTAILKALDKLQRQILHHATNVEWYNIWPNDIKHKTAKIVGKYIALTFQFKAKTWILVDSVEQGNAVYLWCGENLSEGLDVLTMNKTYAKTQEGIHHRNHAVLRTDTYEIYRKILKDADCLDVLG